MKEGKSSVDKLPGTILAVALLVVVLLAMWFSWRRRRRGQELWRADSPMEDGAPLQVLDGFLVSTTRRDNHLERVFAPGLTYRARVQILVFDSALVIAPNGESETWVSWERIAGVRRATITIDRVTEADGLSVVDWSITTPAGDEAVSTFFRLSPQTHDELEKIITTHLPHPKVAHP